MDTVFDIVKDSSIWRNTNSLAAVGRIDSVLHTGTVRSVANDSHTGELRYMVEVQHRGDTIITPCRMMRRFGGAFNYEDTVMRGYNYNTPKSVAAKAGDVVLIGLIGGQGREGVILGGLTHPTRKSLSVDNGPEHKSEFNGIETYINKDGEYIQTFKGQPTNLSLLNSDPHGPVPNPTYDANVGTSFLKWDKTGSFTVSDNASGSPQRIFIDKANGTIQLESGTVSIKMDKKSQDITQNSATYNATATSSMKLTTPSYVLSSPNIKFGGEAAFEAIILGTSFRISQTAMHTQLMAGITALQAALTAFTSALTAASSGILTPPAGAAIKAASIALSTASAAATTTMTTAVATFESTIAARQNGLSLISKTL